MNKFSNLLLLALWLIVATAHAGTVTYVYTDPQGTPLAEANASGTITARFDYAPYGQSVTSMGVAPNGPGYTGHVNDPDTGLVYMQARYYDPAIGRFLSIDPITPAIGNTFNFNRYDYANNNPVGNIDPTGMDDCGPHCMEHRAQSDSFIFGSSDGGGSSDSQHEEAATTSSLHLPGCGTPECDEVKATHAKIMRDGFQEVGEAGKFGAKFIAVNFLSDGLGRLFGKVANFIGIGGKAALGREIKLADGYYQAKGSPFKFSEYYYNKLQSTGRGSPFLQAQEVLDTANAITPDKRWAGYYRYDNGVLEMVYNPTTKEVWHIQPIGK